MKFLIIIFSLLIIAACKHKNVDVNTSTESTEVEEIDSYKPSQEVAKGIESIHFDGTTLTPGKWPMFRAKVLQPIIDLDREKIKEMVDFPLNGEWNYLMGDNVEPTSVNFYSQIDKVFNNELRDILSEFTSQDIAYNRAENRYEVIVNTTESVEEGSEEMFESAYMLYFREINTKWKLVAFHLAG